MATKKTIAIIGATGEMACAISRSLVKGNYRLLLISNQIDEVNSIIRNIKKQDPRIEIEAHSCAMEASWEADIIVLAVPHSAEREVCEKIKPVATGKMVISIGHSTLEELQRLLPHSKIVKAFNRLGAAEIIQPIIDGKVIDAFVSSCDDESLQIVHELVDIAGWKVQYNQDNI